MFSKEFPKSGSLVGDKGYHIQGWTLSKIHLKKKVIKHKGVEFCFKVFVNEYFLVYMKLTLGGN